MAQYNITIDSEILHYLFLKGVKDEGMTKLLESVLNQVLQAQAAEQIKAEPYERTEEREVSDICGCEEQGCKRNKQIKDHGKKSCQNRCFMLTGGSGGQGILYYAGSDR